MPTIALLGTGLLGEAIGRRLLERGVTLKVWNRSSDKCESLLKQGAVLIENLAGAAKGCQAVITVRAAVPDLQGHPPLQQAPTNRLTEQTGSEQRNGGHQIENRRIR